MDHLHSKEVIQHGHMFKYEWVFEDIQHQLFFLLVLLDVGHTNKAHHEILDCEVR